MSDPLRIVILVAAAVTATGCQTIGPGSIPRDRLDYAGAIAGSWREQTLLNIVKLRYFDAPVFLEVSSVISSYTLQSEVNIEAQAYPFSTSTGANNTNRRLGISGTYIDRPTISYTPVTGDKYIGKLLRPIPPQAIFAMIQAGHPADYILSLTARAINDVFNSSSAPARSRRQDPAFYRVIEAFRRIQMEGALGMRIEKHSKGETTLIFFREKVSPEVEKDIHFVKDMLGIKHEVKEIPLTFGLPQPKGGEIALLTRSMWEILAELSAGVEVPQQDAAEGRATAAPQPVDLPKGLPTARIYASSERPANAYIAARYRDQWFWVDDRDIASKRIFTFLMVFSSIAETGAVPQIPVITIPAN
jgi:hypothetical protein